MQSKRVVTLFSVLLLIVFTATACNGGDSAEEAPADAGDVTTIEGITETETTVEDAEVEDTEVVTDTDIVVEDTDALTDTEAVTETESPTETGTTTDTEIMTETGMMTETESITDTATMTDMDSMTGTDVMTETETMTETGMMTATAGLAGAGDRMMMGSTLSSYSVENPAGENLGNVEDEVINLATGRVNYLVLSFGGFLGIGATKYAIPISSFTFESERIETVDTEAPVDPAAAPADDDAAPAADVAAAPAAQVYVPPRLVLNITEEQLEGAPAFVGEETLLEPTWSTDVDRFWGVETDAADTEATDAGLAGAGPGMMLGSMLQDYPVENAEGENLGNVEDEVINLESSNVEYLVLSFGGFLGIGATKYAIPMSAFTFEDVSTEEADAGFGTPRLVLDITEEQLEGAPAFVGEETLLEPTWSTDVDSFWGVEAE